MKQSEKWLFSREAWWVWAGGFTLLCVGLLAGAYVEAKGQSYLMKDYDLYNCIYNNADMNDFNGHPVMVQKIQDECICFREKDYNGTRIFDEGCLQ